MPRTQNRERVGRGVDQLRLWSCRAVSLVAFAVLFWTGRSDCAVGAGLRAENSAGAAAAKAASDQGGAKLENSDPSLERYIRDFESSYHGVQTLRAQFTQTYLSGGRTRVESGTVYLARGSKMRWDYREPESKLFVSDGKVLSLYVPEEKQLTRSPIRESGDVRVPLSILLARLDLRKVFSKVEFAREVPEVDSGDRVLRAYPKPGYEEEYRSALIELTPALDIRRLVISYPDSSTMQFDFARIERNVSLEPSLFEFTPPPGTEVIQQ